LVELFSLGLFSFEFLFLFCFFQSTWPSSWSSNSQLKIK
jgi:hypothetical protein